MSELTVDTLTNQAIQLAKAWVNFNSVGVVAILSSFNVSSITDNGVGNYTVNLTSAMPDANYVAVGTASYTNDSRESNVQIGTATTSTFQLLVTIGSSSSNNGERSDNTAIQSLILGN